MIPLTVATLNLHNRQDRWLSRRDVLVAELLDRQPDVLALQEVYMPIRQAHWLKNQINARLSGRSNEPYRLVQARRRHLWGGYVEGVAILSRLPVVSHDVLPLGYGGRVALRANLELPTGADMDFVTVHLHRAADEREARLEQVMRVVGWLNERNPTAFQVVAGDFNETPDGPAIGYMKQLYRSAFAARWG